MQLQQCDSRESSERARCSSRGNATKRDPSPHQQPAEQPYRNRMQHSRHQAGNTRRHEMLGVVIAEEEHKHAKQKHNSAHHQVPGSNPAAAARNHVSPIPGPTPAYPSNAPCWVAKGPRSVWYTGNGPGQAISVFFTDGQGGVFYKSVSLPGSPTDLTVSADKKWLAVIYTASGEAYVAVFSIDSYGGLTSVATSPSLGVPSFNGVAISE